VWVKTAGTKLNKQFTPTNEPRLLTARSTFYCRSYVIWIILLAPHN